MAISLGFVTGARSDYGLTRKLLSELSNDSDFEVYIYVTGLHLLNKYGYTINEIMGDGHNIKKAISTYTEDGRNKVYEFTTTVDKVYRALSNENLDAVYIVGDRIEAYASALAAHFLGIPIVHYAGGQITKGAVDNIYRYNISNLASIHLTTCKSAFERLRNNYPIESENVYLVGSTAVDAIFEYKKNPQPISEVFPVLKQGNFALMTFQPVTKSEEPIAALMDSSIKKILKYKVKVLVTYPNNDTGSEEIIKIIQRHQKNDNVIVSKSLGAAGYYTTLDNCSFVIGNSSSGIVEAPYFSKPVLNIGTRQEGRDKDVCVNDIEPQGKQVEQAIENGFKKEWPQCSCNHIYGTGNSIKKIKKILVANFRRSYTRANGL